ncbi:MAG: tetratricopeptide repeat protein [Planctomycetota bacterium]
MIVEQEMTPEQDTRRRAWTIGGLIFGIVLVFAPCWTASIFITNEDSILRLPLLSTWRNLPIIFSQRFMIFSDGIYRPLGYGLIAVLRTFVPAETVWFWHTILIALHGLNVWLVFRIVKHFVKHDGAALLAAAVFACHPLASVLANDINELHLLMGSTFYFAALACFLSYRRGEGTYRLLAAFLLFAIGLLTSRVVVTLPLALVVHDLVYERRRPGRETACLLPFVALVPAAIGLWACLGPHPILYTYSASAGGEWPSFLSIVAGSSYYACGLLLGEGMPTQVCDMLAGLLGPIGGALPEGLRLGAEEILSPLGKGIPVVLHDVVGRIFTPAFPAFILWAALHVVVLFFAVTRVARRQAAGLAILLIYIGLLPFMTTAFNPVNEYVSWAYLYVPLAGLCLLIAALAGRVRHWRRSWARILAWVALCLLVPMYACQLLHLNWAARSPVRYWTLAVEKGPESQTAQAALGGAYLAEGDVDRAMEHLFNRSSVELREPCRLMCEYYLAQGDIFAATMHASFSRNSATMASLFSAMGALDHAESRLGVRLARNPYDTAAMKSLADIFTKKGFVEDARRWLGCVLEIDPTDAEAKRMLDALSEMDQRTFISRPPTADWLRFIVTNRTTARLRNEIIEKGKGYPNDPIVQMRVAHCLMENGDVPRAMAVFEKTYGLLPSYAPLASMISWALSASDKPEGGAEQFTKRTVERSPEALRHYDLGTAFASQGRLDEAIAQFRMALEIDPNDPQTHYQLGLALSQSDRLDEAVWHYSEALRAEPDSADAHYNLAVACFQKSDYAAAWKHVEEARRLGKTIPADFLDKLRAKTERTKKK